MFCEHGAGSIPVTANEEAAVLPLSKAVVDERQAGSLVHEVTGLQGPDGEIHFRARLHRGPDAEHRVESAQRLPRAATHAHARRHPFDPMLFTNRLRQKRFVPKICRDESAFRIVRARLNVTEDKTDSRIDRERFRQFA